MTEPGFGVLVEEEELVPAPVPDTGPLEPGEVREHLGIPQWVRRRVIKRQEVDLGQIRSQLDSVQNQVDSVLAQLGTEQRQGFALHEVQVSVGISAQGSIAVVTAGVQASLTLVYSRG